MSLYEFMALVRGRLWLLLALLAVSIGLGAAYLVYAEPVYRVGARMLVQREALAPGQPPPEADKDFLATQAEIIRSPAVVRSAVESLDGRAADDRQRRRAAMILESLSVNPLLGTNVLSVSLQGPDAERATRTVEAIIASYRTYVRDSERAHHLDALRALTASERELRSDLQALEEEYRKLRGKSPLLGEGEDAARVQRELLTHLGETLSDTKSKRMELQNRIAALERMRRANLASVKNSQLISTQAARAKPVAGGEPDGAQRIAASSLVSGSQQVLSQYAEGIAGDLTHIQEQLYAAQAREKELLEKYGHKHPEVRSVREQIDAWERRLRDRIDAAPAVLEQELEATRMQEQQLAERYQEEFEEAKLVDNYLLQERQAKAHIERTQEVHDSILAQVRQWRLADEALAHGKTGTTVKVLEEPALAERQVWPPKLLVLGACGLIGLMGGLGLVLITGRSEEGVAEEGVAETRSGAAEDRRRGVSLPVLERIPAAPPLGDSAGAAPCRAALNLPDSEMASALRRLCTRVERTLSDSSGAAIHVASAAARTGKTSIIANMAIVFAQQGKKVAVVDADLRHGILGEVFDVFGSVGLSSVLRESASLEDALQRSPLAAVDVLTRGSQSADCAELLSGAKLEAVLESLRSQYDLVLVDAPALPDGDEGLATAQAVDGVLLAINQDEALQSDVQHWFELLESRSARLIGTILICIEPEINEARAPSQGASPVAQPSVVPS